MNTHAHRRLIAHELGHAITALLCGLRVKRVWAPPPEADFFDAPPADPDEVAGFVEFHRGGDRRAQALALLGGPLAEGKTPPSWPIQPRTDDERQLVKLVGEGDELTYLEAVRDAALIVGSDEFGRMNMLASELIAGPPHKLDERQLNDIKRTEDIMQSKSHEEEDDEPTDARELEARLVREGIIPARASQYQRADPVLTGLGGNGDHASEEKAHHSRIRTEARDHMLALFEAAEPERKSFAVKIATFDC